MVPLMTEPFTPCCCAAVLVPDICMILNFLPASLDHLVTNGVADTTRCKLSAFVAIAQIMSLNMGTVLIAFTTWRMIIGKKTSDSVILAGYQTFAWGVGIILASVFLIEDTLGHTR
jgi:hypothetical protein